MYYSQTCMVNAPSKSQLKRTPISFIWSDEPLAHVDAGSILKRTIGPTLMEFTGVVCTGVYKDSHEKEFSFGIDVNIRRCRVTGGEGCEYHYKGGLVACLKRRTRLATG